MRRAVGICAVVAGLGALASVNACSFLDDFGGLRARGDIHDESDFQQDLTDLLCAKALDCETKAGLPVSLQLLCHPELRKKLSAAPVLRQYALGPGAQATFHVDAARRCIAALYALPRCVVPWKRVPSECAGVYTGQVPLGEPCTADSECGGGWCEFVGDRCPSGICVATKAPGDSCTEGAGVESGCPSDMVCRKADALASETTCEAPCAAGDPCGDAADCATGFWCRAETGRCEATPQLGEPCSTALGVDPCAGVLVCKSGTTGPTCVPGGQSGDPCGSTDGSTPACGPGHRCDSTRHRCVPVGQDACEITANCPLGFTCKDVQCAPNPVVGEVCDASLPCVEGICSGGVCVLGSAEEMCGVSLLNVGQCQGYCDVGGVCQDVRMPGESCGSDEECVVGSVCRDVGTGSWVCTSCGAAAGS